MHRRLDERLLRDIAAAFVLFILDLETLLYHRVVGTEDHLHATSGAGRGWYIVSAVFANFVAGRNFCYAHVIVQTSTIWNIVIWDYMSYSILNDNILFAFYWHGADGIILKYEATFIAGRVRHKFNGNKL